MRNNKGFTLIEVIAVLTIISVLVLFATKRNDTVVREAEISKLMVDCGVVESAINIYKIEHSTYPVKQRIENNLLKSHANRNKVATIDGLIKGEDIPDGDILEVDLNPIKEHIKLISDGDFYIDSDGVVYLYAEDI